MCFNGFANKIYIGEILRIMAVLGKIIYIIRAVKPPVYPEAGVGENFAKCCGPRACTYNGDGSKIRNFSQRGVLVLKRKEAQTEPLLQISKTNMKNLSPACDTKRADLQALQTPFQIRAYPHLLHNETIEP